MTRYTAGWNTPGTLPDTTEPTPIFDTQHEAIAYLLAEAEQSWNEEYETSDTDGTRMDADDKWLPVHTALHTAMGVGTTSWSATTGDHALEFWVHEYQTPSDTLDVINGGLCALLVLLDITRDDDTIDDLTHLVAARLRV